MRDLEKKKISDTRWRKKNKRKHRETNRARRRRIKTLVLSHYGESCKKCGFSDPRALQIDHIHNNGAAERRKLGGLTGWNFYVYLIKMNFPEGYQTLCANCNMIKQMGESF